MWVFTLLGFFSIVAHRDRPGYVLVRARVRADLIALVRLLPLPRPKVQRTPHADYLFRAVVNKEAMAGVLATLTEGIDYDNFKTAVAEVQGVPRAKVYQEVWQSLLTLQEQPPKLTLVRSKPKARRGPGGMTFGMISGADLEAIEHAKAERLAEQKQAEQRIAAMPPALDERVMCEGSDLSFEGPDFNPDDYSSSAEAHAAFIALVGGAASQTIETDAGMMLDASAKAHYAALKKTMHPLTFARLYDQSKGEGISFGNLNDPPGRRKPTGTVVTVPDGRLQGIITVHGKRKRLPPFPHGTSQAMAQERTALQAEHAAALGLGKKI
jgi:hypothetical protein